MKYEHRGWRIHIYESRQLRITKNGIPVGLTGKWQASAKKNVGGIEKWITAEAHTRAKAIEKIEGKI